MDDEITMPETPEAPVAVLDPEPTIIICHGITKAGNPCKREATPGKLYCSSHTPVGVTPEAKDPGGLKPYPFFDGGVNENVAIRMIAMVQPQCPIESTPEIKRPDGTYTPNPRYTGEQNCQQAYKLNNQGVWDVQRCVALGHDPYHRTVRTPIVEEVVDEKTGYVTETRTRIRIEKALNVIQVSDNERHSNGTEVALALARGCKWLEEFGYARPCEFRNCSRPWTIDTRFGKYCSERHARLVGADKHGILLPIGGDPYTEDQARREREQALESINTRKNA